MQSYGDTVKAEKIARNYRRAQRPSRWAGPTKVKSGENGELGKKVKIRRKEKIFFAMVTVRRNSTGNREKVR